MCGYYSCMAKLSGKEIQKLARTIVNEMVLGGGDASR